MFPKQPADLDAVVTTALTEDIGNGDYTTALLPENCERQAQLICRQTAVLCGIPWFNAALQKTTPGVQINWMAHEGESMHKEQLLCQIKGKARGLLKAERTAINFLQTLSATATITRQYVQQLRGLKTQLLDTRKTIPGLRTAQKYAVVCGGGTNHRVGLFDAILIKENHIAAAGGIANVFASAQQYTERIMIEVENLSELETALSIGIPHILLDNFKLALLKKAVRLTDNRAQLEASGNINLDNIRAVAETGVDYISVGALTKHLQAIDFSLQIMSTEYEKK